MTNSKSSGFTLLELLIALTISGLIVIALMQGVTFAGNAWQSEEKRTSHLGNADGVANVVRNLIASGRNFHGDATSLSFVSALPEALADRGLYDVRIHAAGGQLLLDWSPRITAGTGHSGETQLSANVGAVEFAYRVASSGWRRAVDDKSPPALISVTVHRGDGVAAPALLVAPVIDAKASPN